MVSVRNVVVVVGCVFVGFVTSAGPSLVARAAEPPRWGDRTSPSSDGASLAGTRPSDGGDAQRRIAQLEQRLRELEATRRGAGRDGHARESASDELNAMVARNRELTERNRELAAENQSLVQGHLFEPKSSVRGCEQPPGDADPRAQLRYWAEQLRDSDTTFRGRLTSEQNAAVQVLVRRERELDPRNPWRDP